MLTKRLIRQLPKRYSTISFTPNENKHIFESERLSPRENHDAIPDKPDFSNIDKIHHEIVNPEEVADLVTKLNTNDVLISILSKNKRLYGDEHYNVRNVKDSKEPPIVFPYSSILLSWKEVYNKQIKDLKEIQPVTFTLPIVDFKYLNLYKGNSLEEFFHKSRAVKNSTSIKKGTVQSTDVDSLFTVECASNVVLNSIESSEALEEFMVFISTKIEFFTFQGLKDLLTSVTMSCSKFPVNGSSMDQLVTTMANSHPRILRALDHDTKDVIAHSLIETNPELAKNIIKDLIEDCICPSEKTLDRFFDSYKSKGPVTSLQELSFLKSVIHHCKFNDTTFNLIMETITNVNELIKLVTLLKKTPNMLQEKQNELYSKLRSLTTSELTTTQFLRFLTKNNVKLNEELKKRVGRDYSDDSNIISVLDRL
ncbi:hypothetical protein KGF57_001041 [Candida theae]|uniref:ATPase expression protein 1 n=1 Tax=Candida theae TaxID=1198502 RepID=A0AAD5BII1_9ASCO|nr:uncharacterized protein KGF57_001041 [Candida theae]KAI5964549.1 hypothetical protein KGF57_001041 [Candida theae]